MTLKLKLWIQALVPILCVTILGGAFVLWTTISQQKQLIKNTLISNVKQLENEIRFASANLEKTINEHINKSNIVESARSLYKITDTLPELKRTIQCETISALQQLIQGKEYDVVAIYNPANLETYATRSQIFAVSTNPVDNSIEYYAPTAGSALLQCFSKEWRKISKPAINLPTRLKIPAQKEIHLAVTGNQLNITGILPVNDISYYGGKANEKLVGAALLRQRITNNFMLNFSNKTSLKSDLFSLSGKHIAGAHFDRAKELPLHIINQFKGGELFTEINIKNRDYYMMVRAYHHMDKPVFLMASFASREIVSKNIKDIFFLQFAGIIVGMIFATIVAIFMEKIITKPITKVTEQMNRIYHENRFDQRVIIESNDEIGRLAGSFNNMTAMLEMEVEKRTHELSETITALQKSYDDLQKAYKKISELEQVKTNFVSTVSHELRTPLTSILGFAMATQKSYEKFVLPAVPLTDKKAEKKSIYIKDGLAIVISEATRLSRLINDLLDIAKMESGEMQWKIKEVDILDICGKTLTAIAGYPKSDLVEVSFEAPKTVRPIKGDPDRIFQVITNLMSNALKFTKQGRVILRVEAMGNAVKVTISDTGIGLSKDSCLKVFDKFTQIVDDNDVDRPKGTGLGLPICKEIIKHMGGKMWAESEIGKGSNFYFTINYFNSKNQA